MRATCRHTLELKLIRPCVWTDTDQVSIVNSEQQADEEARAREGRVVALVHDIAHTINAGEIEEREFLREFAVNLLRDEVQLSAPTTAAALAPPAASFNPFGIGIPLFLMGAVLVFLFPPVGLVLFAAAAVVVAWGMGSALFARS